ncbi:DUF2935 domain-containing protein [Alkalihalobacterium bogoriense]|uniref:DUF2935 domain-containing protein n=1 Tax=Alkalihalobacterium bogoriense TaxID=246272 RepID=UPI00047EDA91|nr:DUF2935 domain-containing protein [Alkalihalobacterium bogoriense]
MKSFEETALFEHHFWLQVLGDHSRFIYDTLSPREEEHVATAKHFIEMFDNLLYRSKQPMTREQLLQLSEEAIVYAKEIREFKLDIIKEHLVGDVVIELSPTFLNHMVNEVEEYIRILPYLLNEEIPPACHPLHHHLVWLLDAAGHADGISGSLDMVEKKLLEKSQDFTKTFEQYYIKAVEMAGYLRANIDKFPALDRFNDQVQLEIILFKNFLDELEELEMTNRMLGTLQGLMADHMAREECYYLMKLAESTDLQAPHCDPTSPRSDW